MNNSPISLGDLVSWMVNGQAWQFTPEQYRPVLRQHGSFVVVPGVWRGFLTPDLRVSLTINPHGFLVWASDFVVKLGPASKVDGIRRYKVSRLVVWSNSRVSASYLIGVPKSAPVEEDYFCENLENYCSEERLPGTFRSRDAAEQAARHANALRPTSSASHRLYTYTSVFNSTLTQGRDQTLTTLGFISGDSSYSSTYSVPTLTFFGWAVLRLSGVRSVTSNRALKWDQQWETGKNTVKTVVLRILWGTNGKKTVKTA